MTIRFEHARVLVTGGGKGIGREIASIFAECGARVIAVSRTQADLDQLRNEIGGESICCDLATVEGARDVAEKAGTVDFLVNNAGISIPQSMLSTTPEALDHTFAVNVRASLIIAQSVARQWVARKHAGAIVNISSQASLAALADHAAYCASKAALDALTRVMALELGPHGIRVNSLNPTVTLTPMGEMAWGDPAKSGPMLAKIPLGRFAKPRDVAEAVVFLMSDHAKMISGVSLPLDGGFLAT